jgi:hypothetical protein
MASSGKLRRVALVRTDVSGELSAFIIRVTRIDELGMLAEDYILHSHHHENLKSYIISPVCSLVIAR